MTRAVRSPGSTLKPLIYGLAFELGLAHPETLIEDKPVDFAGYSPENFDREFHGTVSIRRALQLSLNVPAIELLEAVGPARLVARMRRAGATPRSSRHVAARPRGRPRRRRRDADRPRRHPRRDRARRHGGAARRSTPSARFDLDTPAEGARRARRLVCRLDPRRRARPPTMSRPARSPSRPAPPTAIATPGRSASTAATSIGVWVGRPDGAPVPGLIGVDAAAPILMDAFARLGSRHAAPRRASGNRRGDRRQPAAAAPPLPLAERAARRGRGAAGDRLSAAGRARRSRHPRRRSDAARAESARRRAALHLVRRRRADRHAYPSAARCPGSRRGPGFVDLMVIDADGASATRTVFVE